MRPGRKTTAVFVPAVFVLLLALSACGGGDDEAAPASSTSSAPRSTSAGGSEVKTRSLAVGVLPGTGESADGRGAVAGTADDARALLAAEQVTGQDAAVDQVDFAAEQLVLVIAPTAPTAGYRATATGARVDGDRLVVTLEVAPPSGMSAQVLTDPYALIAVDRAGAPTINSVVVEDATP